MCKLLEKIKNPIFKPTKSIKSYLQERYMSIITTKENTSANAIIILLLYP